MSSEVSRLITSAADTFLRNNSMPRSRYSALTTACAATAPAPGSAAGTIAPTATWLETTATPASPVLGFTAQMEKVLTRCQGIKSFISDFQGKIRSWSHDDHAVAEADRPPGHVLIWMSHVPSGGFGR